jgi:hypothetical protein
MEWKILVNYLTIGIFYSHLVNFRAIWLILWSFGIFFPFWYDVRRKIWQPCSVVMDAFLSQSHGSLTIRFGVIIFGIVTFGYLLGSILQNSFFGRKLF